MAVADHPSPAGPSGTGDGAAARWGEWPDSLRPTLVGERYMISAGHPLVAEAAAHILEQGGTAIDAGVAAGLVSNVVQADQCNLGGVAPILLRHGRSDTVWCIDGVGRWSRDVDIGKYLARYPQGRPLGAPCAVVPAAVDAWISALARFGTRSLADVAGRAIALAEGGFLLDDRTARSFAGMADVLALWQTTRSIYWPEGRPPRTGDRLVQRDLAATLRHLVAAERSALRIEGLEQARRAFYAGAIAHRIVDWVTANGGWMDLADLADFRCDVFEAPSVDYGGWRVHSGGLYGQGPVLLETLAILAGFDLPALGHNSADYVHVVAEALKLAFADREQHYGDPSFVATRLPDLLDADRIAALRARIAMDGALPDMPSLPGPVRGAARRDTTGFAVVDGAGNAFSCSPSDTLDGCPIIPGLGIIASPRGLQSRLDPAHPASLQPGKRPRMTASPAMAISLNGDGAARVMAFNAPGGDVIVQGELQAFLNIVAFGMSPQQAIEAARFATLSFPDSFYPHPHDPGRLNVEARIGEAARTALTSRGHDVRAWPDWAFDATAVALVMDLEAPRGGARVLGAGADPRRSNYAWGR